MANLGETYNTDDADFDDDLFPQGTYHVQVIENSIEEARSGNGKKLNLTFEVLDGDFQNRRMFESLNIGNVNEQSREIAQRSLRKLAKAVGVQGEFDDADVLMFKSLLIDVAIRKDKNGQYPDRNTIRKFIPYDNGPAPQVATNAAPSRPASNTNSAAPPSQRRAAAGGGSRPWDGR